MVGTVYRSQKISRVLSRRIRYETIEIVTEYHSLNVDAFYKEPREVLGSFTDCSKNCINVSYGWVVVDGCRWGTAIAV